MAGVPGIPQRGHDLSYASIKDISIILTGTSKSESGLTGGNKQKART